MNSIYAAIDLGSNNIKLKIVQYISGEITLLEDISKPIGIGDEVFESGMIGNNTAIEIIDVISEFKSVMATYSVQKYRAVATGGMREARNGRNITERILMKTGIDVEIIEDTIEKFLTYKSMRDKMDNYQEIRNSALVVELNAGSCDISLYGRNKLIRNEEFALGMKTLKHMIRDIEDRTQDYPSVVHEFISTQTRHIFSSIKAKEISNFLAIGGYVRHTRQHFFGDGKSPSRSDFEELFSRIISDHRTLRNEVEEHGMDWYEFMGGMLVFHTFMDLVSVDRIEIPDITLRDGLIAEMIEGDYSLVMYSMFNKDPIHMAKQISKRFKSDKDHIKNVERNAVEIFTELSRIYPFSERDELILRLASILHEIGRFTRMKDYLSASYDKISNLSILGVTHDEMLMVANISKFLAVSETSPASTEFDLIEKDKQGIILKLLGIMSIADSLDKGKQQKITLEHVKAEGDILKLVANVTGDTTLEEWTFENRAKEFEDTFGLKPILIFGGEEDAI